MKTVKTPKGTELPLVNLKGKDYLQVAHRLIWFNEEVPTFEIETQLLEVSDAQTIARTTVSVTNADGSVVRKATATKRETKADFSDHTEKAETGSLGRALAMLGFGTQFAIADLDEGSRIVDAPVTNTKPAVAAVFGATAVVAPAPAATRTSFKTPVPTATTVVANGNGAAKPAGHTWPK